MSASPWFPYDQSIVPQGTLYIVPDPATNLVEFYDNTPKLTDVYDENKQRLLSKEQLRTFKPSLGVWLPPVFEVVFEEFKKEGAPHVTVLYNGMQLGDELNDNSRGDDGYRYHDCAHFIQLVHYGQSRVIDTLLEGPHAPKPQTRDMTAEMQTSFEESLPLMAFNLRDKDEWVRKDKPRPAFLKMLSTMSETARFEPHMTRKLIGTMIGEFYKNIDLLYKNHGGSLVCDQPNKTVTYKASASTLG